MRRTLAVYRKLGAPSNSEMVCSGPNPACFVDRLERGYMLKTVHASILIFSLLPFTFGIAPRFRAQIQEKMAPGLAGGETQDGGSIVMEPCHKEERQIEGLIRSDQLAEGFSLQVASVPALTEAVISLQVSSSSEQAPEVLQLTFCEVKPSVFRITDGRVTATTVVVDRDPPRWLVGVSPGPTLFKLAGFPDSLAGFNKLILSLNVNIKDQDVALEVFDCFLRLTGAEMLRESVVVDEMQLQGKALADFRQRYSSSQARPRFTKWWDGINPSIKRQLKRPSAKSELNGFSVSYFRYSQGDLFREVVEVNKNGTLSVLGCKVVYPLQQANSNSKDCSKSPVDQRLKSLGRQTPE